MTQNTKGPWAIWPSRYDNGETCEHDIAIGPTGGGIAIAQIVAVDGRGILTQESYETGCANARLISAAPDLLSALKNLTEWGRTHTSPRDANSPHTLLIAACEAIDKAEGRTA